MTSEEKLDLESRLSNWQLLAIILLVALPLAFLSGLLVGTDHPLDPRMSLGDPCRFDGACAPAFKCVDVTTSGEPKWLCEPKEWKR